MTCWRGSQRASSIRWPVSTASSTTSAASRRPPSNGSEPAMRFIKYQGCGNDYIYVDCVRNKAPADPVRLSRAISDRHFGVGADGLILIAPSERADVRMRMFNADGSEAEMCGNGIRCLAKYAFDHGLTRNNPLTVETGRGVLTLQLELKAGKVDQVTVQMGAPILEADRIPTTFPGPRVINHVHPAFSWKAPWVAACGLEPGVTCVSMGNPHAVFYCRDVAKVPLTQIGPD